MNFADEIDKPQYAAPELFMGILTEKADVWAFGCILYELAAHKKAYSKTEMMDALQQKPFNIPHLEGYSANFNDFITMMLNGDYTKRPTAAQLLNSQALKNEVHKATGMQ